MWNIETTQRCYVPDPRHWKHVGLTAVGKKYTLLLCSICNISADGALTRSQETESFIWMAQPPLWYFSGIAWNWLVGNGIRVKWYSMVLKGTPTLTDDGFALIWNPIMIALSCHYHCSDGTKLLSSCFGESAIESGPADHRTLNRQRPKYLECNKSSTDPGGGF